MVSWVLAVSSLFASSLVQPTDPMSIVGGTDATDCEFPAAVSVLDGSGTQFCTAALVHPRVVMLAAHCVQSMMPQSIGFGETVAAPQGASVPVQTCASHPDFMWVDQLLPMDLAYCTLAADAPAVPIVPPLMGCEADQLVPDAEITLVGFGFDDETGTGNTRKRWTVNTVQTVDEENNDLILLGVDGASACFGDSGGPAYMQLSDGSWRLVGITSEAHPDVVGQPTICGYGVIYELVHLQMAWLEAETGYDLTPCFEPDGTWSADEDCGGFPTELGSVMGWGAACSTDALSGASQTCGEAFGEMGTSSSSGGDTETEGDGDTSGGLGGTGGGDSSTGSPGATSTGVGTTTVESGGDSSGGEGFGAAESSSGGAGQDDGDGGCGCRSGSGSGFGGLLLLGLVLRRRRT